MLDPIKFPLKLQNENMHEEQCVLRFLHAIISNKVVLRLRFTEAQTYSASVSVSSVGGGDNFSADGFSYYTMMVAFGLAEPKAWDLIGMETVCDCRTATGDTIEYTTKHLASPSLDQFVQMDDMKEDTMPTDPDNLFKTITFYPPGVELPPPDFVEEIRRPSPSEMMSQYAFWQRMKKDREDHIMTTMGRACRTCTNGGGLRFNPAYGFNPAFGFNPMPDIPMPSHLEQSIPQLEVGTKGLW